MGSTPLASGMQDIEVGVDAARAHRFDQAATLFFRALPICMFARFLGLDSYKAKLGVGDAETLEFEIVSPERQYVSDAVLDKALAPVIAALNYRADNRYFLIRDCRSATGMTYRLTTPQLGAIGGEASLAQSLGAGVQLAAGSHGLYEINQAFSERMRVMFLAEEIAPVKAGLGAATPELGHQPVRAPLTWIPG